MKIMNFSPKKCFLALTILASFSPSLAEAQQISKRNGYTFKTVRNPYSLSRAVAIEQAENGFGVKQNVTNTITTNSSTAVGTLTEVQAILEGDNSSLDLTATNTPTNSGTQTSSSEQNN